MILKKPYGLLIKHFRLIHLILSSLTIYLAIRTYSVVDFFVSYISNNYSVTVTDSLVTQTISPFIYVFLILVIGIFIALFVLLRYKKKPNKIYLASIIYYIILLIAIIIASTLIGSLSEGLWETAAARQYRDFAQLIFWPQIFFIIVAMIRTLGFDVKKFDFKKDLQELDLTDKDSELVEINLGFDTSKAKRTLRRLIREFNYYFKENKFIFICIGVVLVGALGFLIFRNYEKLNYNYNQGKSFSYEGFNITAEDSIITNIDQKGNIINENYYYLIVKFNVTNNSNVTGQLNSNNFIITLDKKDYTPTLDIGKYFVDYGYPYYNSIVSIGNSQTYIFTYVIEKEKINKNFIINLYIGASTKKNTFTPKNLNIKLNPIKVDNVTLANNYTLNQTLTLSSTNLKDTRLTITDYEIVKNYTYTYESCVNGNCREYKNTIYSGSDKTLLIIGYEFELDKTSEYATSYQSINAFIRDFVSFNYTLNYQLVNPITKNVTPANLTNKIAIEMPQEINESENISLNLTIRNYSFNIYLNEKD